MNTPMSVRIPIKVQAATNAISVSTEPTTIVATTPKGVRDAWAVLWGRYEVLLREKKPNDLASVNQVLREVWSKPADWGGEAVSKVYPDEASRGGISRRWRR